MQISLRRLKKVIKDKNKKMQNNANFHFYSDVIAKKQPPMKNLEKIDKKFFLGTAGLSK